MSSPIDSSTLASATGTSTGSPPEGTIVEHLARGFSDHGERIALRFGDRSLSYAELDALTNRLANALVAEGIGRGDRVGVALDRSIELVAVVVGVLRAGAAYVPLDPTYPTARLSAMVGLADLRLLITHDHHADHFTSGLRRGSAIGWADLEVRLSTTPGTPRTGGPGPGDDAYVIFTSGSTGTPKGVEMPHRALANLVSWQLGRPSFHRDARVLQYSSISFDVSFQEIATTLASGGELVLIDDERRRDPHTLLDALIADRIERLYLPYVALRSLVGTAVHQQRYPVDLREVITAGERLRVDDTLRTFFEHVGDATLDNQYGPSETHVVTAHLLEGDPSMWPDLPPIGTAIDENKVLLLDDEMRAVDTNRTGELYVTGRNLARGYLGRPDLSAERFVDLPGSGERAYRTGDLGLVADDGEIHYQGRIDDQVKIRGHRVEPAEVDAAATHVAGVAHCFTRVFHNPAGNAYLSSYVIASPDADVDPADVRSELRTRLPDYLVPAFVFRIEQVATGPSGKADLRSLPHPTELVAGLDATYESDTEEKLAGIWAELLGFASIDRDASFFDLGGDSLAAVTLFLAISEDFGVDLPLATLTRAPTVAALARVIDEGEASTSGDFRSLQVLNAGSVDVPPLCLVHGGAGNVLIFREFATRLGPHQTVYGFQWSGWDGGRGEHTVESMAAAYVTELRRAHPNGPYRLGGHCLGGLVAIEMAHLLEAAGEVVEGPLLVSDAPNLAAASYHRSEPDANAVETAEFTQMVERLRAEVPPKWREPDAVPTDADSGTSDDASPEELRRRSRVGKLPVIGPLYVKARTHPRAAIPVRTLKELKARATVQTLVRRGHRIPTDERGTYCRLCTRGAARRHTSRGYAGAMLYFRTETTRGASMALRGWWDDVYMGFSELCRGEFEGHVVGGQHDDALRHPGVAEVVRARFGLGDTETG